MSSFLRYRQSNHIEPICTQLIEWEKDFAFVAKQTRILEDAEFLREDVFWPARLQRVAAAESKKRVKPAEELVRLTRDDYIIRAKGIMYGALTISEADPKKNFCTRLICRLGGRPQEPIHAFQKEGMFPECMRILERDLIAMEREFGLSPKIVTALQGICKSLLTTGDVSVHPYRDLLHSTIGFTRNLPPRILLDVELNSSFLQGCLSCPSLEDGFRNSIVRLNAMWGIIELLSNSKLKLGKLKRVAEGLVASMGERFIRLLPDFLGLDMERLLRTLQSFSHVADSLKPLVNALQTSPILGTKRAFPGLGSRFLNDCDLPCRIRSMAGNYISSIEPPHSPEIEIRWEILRTELTTNDRQFGRLPSLIRFLIFPFDEPKSRKTTLRADLLYRLISLGKDTTMFGDMCGVFVQSWTGYGNRDDSFAFDRDAALCETVTLKKYDQSSNLPPGFVRLAMLSEIVRSVESSPENLVEAKVRSLSKWYRTMEELRPESRDALFSTEGLPEELKSRLEGIIGISMERASYQDDDQGPKKRPRLTQEIDIVPTELSKCWDQLENGEPFNNDFVTFLEKQLESGLADPQIWMTWGTVHDDENEDEKLRFKTKILMFLLGCGPREGADGSSHPLAHQRKRETILKAMFSQGVGSTIADDASFLKFTHITSLLTELFRQPISQGIIIEGDFALWKMVSEYLPDGYKDNIRHQIGLQEVAGPKLRPHEVEEVLGMNELRQRDLWSFVSASYIGSPSEQVSAFIGSVFKAVKGVPLDHSGPGFSMLKFQIELLCLHRTDCAPEIIQLFRFIPKAFSRLYSSIFYIWITRRDFNESYGPNYMVARQKQEVRCLNVQSCSDKATIISALHELLNAFRRARQTTDVLEEKVKEFEKAVISES